MIKGVFGLPGTGKSCYLSYEAHKYMRRNKGKKVYSNYYIDGCYTLDTDNLGVYLYEDCLILIDEISLVFDSRDYKNFPKNVKTFFALSRHFNADVIYCSQSYEDCDKRIRNITDSVFQITLAPFGFSRIRRIVKTLKCSDGSIQEYYETAGLGQFIWRPKQYKYFDSFVRPALPENPEKKWN